MDEGDNEITKWSSEFRVERLRGRDRQLNIQLIKNKVVDSNEYQISEDQGQKKADQVPIISNQGL